MLEQLLSRTPETPIRIGRARNAGPGLESALICIQFDRATCKYCVQLDGGFPQRTAVEVGWEHRVTTVPYNDARLRWEATLTTQAAGQLTPSAVCGEVRAGGPATAVEATTHSAPKIEKPMSFFMA